MCLFFVSLYFLQSFVVILLNLRCFTLYWFCWVLICCSRPETPGRESVWNASTVLDVSSNSQSQQLSGPSPASMSTEGGWNQNWGGGGAEVDMDLSGGGGWDGGGSQNSSSYDLQAHPSQSQNSSSNYGGSSGSSGSSVNDWDVDMIVIFRFGPHTGRYAIIARRPYMSSRGDLIVDLRMRESSSSGKNSLDNDIFHADCRDLRLGEPRRKDRVVVLYGAHKGLVSTVKAVIGEDVVLAELPMDMFKITQVAWLHTR